MRTRLRQLRIDARTFVWRATIHHVWGSGDCHRCIRLRVWGAGKASQALQADLLSVAWSASWGACPADGAYPTSADARAVVSYALQHGWQPERLGGTFVLAEHEHAASFSLPGFLLTDRLRTPEGADPTLRVIRHHAIRGRLPATSAPTAAGSQALAEQSNDAVRDYYASFHRRELDRLLTAEGRLEFALTTRLLRAHLPAAGRVLDIGGGPGRYACWLAEQGLTVTLADLSPNLLDLASELIAESGTDGVEEIVQADVRDLSRWPDGTFASTLALGPFYHLPDARDRRRALAEIVRVTAPGGLVAIALMPRWAFLQRTLSIPDEQARLADPAFVAGLLSRGEYTNPHHGRFPSGYGVDPGQVAKTFAGAGLRQILLASTHGFATGLERSLDELRTNDPSAYDAALDLLTRTATEPSFLGTAGHLLYLGCTAT